MTSPHCIRRSQSLLGLTLVLAAAFSSAYVAHRALAQQSPPATDKASAAAEVGQRGQRTAREIKYGDWRKLCFKAAGTSVMCRSTISGTWETGQTAVRVDLIEREGDGTARLQIFLPVGLYLQAGVKLTVDQGSPYRIPYVWCLTNACIAAWSCWTSAGFLVRKSRIPTRIIGKLPRRSAKWSQAKRYFWKSSIPTSWR